MNALKEKLKKLGSNVAAAAQWVGAHFASLLTIFSVVVGLLFLRQRRKTQELETDLSLKDKTNEVENNKEKVKNAKQKADSSLAAYTDIKSKYESGSKRRVSNVSRGTKKVRRGSKRSSKSKS